MKSPLIRRRLIALATGLLLLVMPLSGCTPGGGADTDNSTSAEVPSGLVLASGQDTDYKTVVRSEKASALVLDSLSKLVKAYREFVPDVEVFEDWGYKPGANGYEAALARHEIVIGVTTRPESAAAAEGLGAKDWRIKADGVKLVIVGGSDWALRTACDVFSAGIKSDSDGVLRYTGPLEGHSDYSGLVIATDQKNSKVEIYDITAASSVNDAVWSKLYSAYNIADARARTYNGKTVILAAFGSSSASMADYETKSVIWSTEKAPKNPHACELIPCDGGYVMAVAGTDGNEVRFYDASAANGSSYVSVELNDAHGALYDPELNVVWCQGLNVLTAYSVSLSGGKITVTERTDLRSEIPTTNAHELQPCKTDSDKLWVTTSSAVYLYSKSSKTFSTVFDGVSSYVNRKGVKGMGQFEDGSIVLITPDGGFKTWTGETVSFFTEGKFENKITIKGAAFYKVRAFDPDYN